MEIFILNEIITMRYCTVIKNIKAKSNSYYDSYLDLLEETIKYFLVTNNVCFDKTKTCGKILKEEKVENFLKNELKISEDVFNKLPDYIKKCNDHKHKKEKNLSIESVVNYLKVYFIIQNCYYEYKNKPLVNFDEEFFYKIFGEDEKLKETYQENTASINNRLKEIEKQNEIILNSINNNNNNHNNYNKIIKEDQRRAELEQFLTSCRKRYLWTDYYSFDIYKKIVIFSTLAMIILGLVITWLNTKVNGFYVTYSLFENIWMFQGILIIIYTMRTYPVMDHLDLQERSTFKCTAQNFMFFKTTLKEKSVYKIFRILCYISTIINIIYVLSSFGKMGILITVLEVIFFALTIVIAIFKKKLHYGFCWFVLFSGVNRMNKKLSIIYVIEKGVFYTYSDFKKKYGNMLKKYEERLIIVN